MDSAAEDQRGKVLAESPHRGLVRKLVVRVDDEVIELSSEPPSQHAIGEDLVPHNPNRCRRATGDAEAASAGPRLIAAADHPISPSLGTVADDDYPLYRLEGFETIDHLVDVPGEVVGRGPLADQRVVGIKDDNKWSWLRGEAHYNLIEVIDKGGWDPSYQGKARVGEASAPSPASLATDQKEELRSRIVRLSERDAEIANHTPPTPGGTSGPASGDTDSASIPAYTCGGDL